MYQKLEDRMKLYEQDHPIKDDDGLISAIAVILNEQESLPVEERDFDLIAEATDSILKLQGYRESDRATMAEEAAALVRTRIARQKGVTSDGKPQNKHLSVLRWIIPLVAVLAITTVTIFASPANRLAISEITHRIYSALEHKVDYHEDNIDLVISSDSTSYSSMEELAKEFHNSILLPFELKKELTELSIDVLNLGQTYDIEISFVFHGNMCLITIFPQREPAENIDYNNKIGDFKIGLTTDTEFIYAEWTVDQVYYQVKSTSMDSIEPIIESMRLSNE